MVSKPWQLPTDRMPPDDEECIDFVRFFRRTFPGVLIYHIPNGGKRGKKEGMRFKCMGVVPGMNDYHCPEFRWWLEMKTQDGGDKGSKAQKEIHERLRAIGDRVDICWGSAAAQAVALEVARESREKKG
jgi:hypothetical protein